MSEAAALLQPRDDAPAAAGITLNHTLLVAGVAALAALPGLAMELHADDWFHIQPRSMSEVLSTFVGDWNRGESGIGGFYRPIVRLSFAIDGALYGLSAWGYHLTNGVLFIASCLMVSMVAALCGGPRAFTVAGLAMALHPAKNEALYWVSGRTDLLALLSVCITLYCWLRWLDDLDDWRWYGAAQVAMLTALATKETAAPLVLLLPLAGLILAPGRLTAAVVPLLIGFLFFAFRSTVLGGIGGYATEEPRTVGLLAKGILQSLGAILLPWQNHSGRLSFSVLMGLLGVTSVGLLLLLTGFRRITTVLVLGMLLFALPLAFASPSPVDGTRLLAIPLGFACVLTGMWASTRTRMVLLSLIALSILPLNVAVIGEFLGASRPARQVLQAAQEAIDALPQDTVIVTPEPDRVQPRRILDAGDSLDQALAARLMAESGSNEIMVLSHRNPRHLAMQVQAKGGPRVLAHSLQPWMTSAAILDASGSSVEIHHLERLEFLHEGPLTTTTLPLGELQPGYWLATQFASARHHPLSVQLTVNDHTARTITVKTADAWIAMAQHRGPGSAVLRIGDSSLRLPVGTVALFAPWIARKSEP